MTIKEQQKKELSNYSKEELIEALTQSATATGFVLERCKKLYGIKKPIKKTTKKEEEK